MNKKLKKIVKRFLKNWKRENYEKMLHDCQITWVYNRVYSDTQFKHFENVFSNLKLIRYKTTRSISSCSDDVTKVYLKLTLDDNGLKRIENVRMLILKEKSPYKLDKNGFWGINPFSMLIKL